MPENKTRSLRALDALNFSNAGILTALGPFLSIFYTSARHWNPGQIGLLIASQSVAGILTQPLVGSFVDETKHKRVVKAAAAAIITACAASNAVFQSYVSQLAIQLLLGLALTVMPAATSAFAVGLAGDGGATTVRVARNETLMHTGNMAFAVLAGVAGTLGKLQWVFYAAALFSAGMIASVLFIRDNDVDYEQSRAGGNDGDSKQRTGWTELFRNRGVLVFAATVVLFNIANAATLPLIGEILAGKQGSHNHAAGQIAAAILVAEVLMIGASWFTGKKADNWGRKPLFVAAFLSLAIRNGFSVASTSQYYLVSLQAFEGVAAGISGVLITLISADLAKGSGRFNFLQGSIQSAMGVGSLVSNATFGAVAKAFSFNASFIGLALVALAGGVLFQVEMPETNPH